MEGGAQREREREKGEGGRGGVVDELACEI
jgi:hypothetical protein